MSAPHFFYALLGLSSRNAGKGTLDPGSLGGVQAKGGGPRVPLLRLFLFVSRSVPVPAAPEPNAGSFLDLAHGRKKEASKQRRSCPLPIYGEEGGWPWACTWAGVALCTGGSRFWIHCFC